MQQFAYQNRLVISKDRTEKLLEAVQQTRKGRTGSWGSAVEHYCGCQALDTRFSSVCFAQSLKESDRRLTWYGSYPLFLTPMSGLMATCKTKCAMIIDDEDSVSHLRQKTPGFVVLLGSKYLWHHWITLPNVKSDSSWGLRPQQMWLVSVSFICSLAMDILV